MSDERLNRIEERVGRNTDRLDEHVARMDRIDRDQHDDRTLELERVRSVRADLAKVDAKADRALEALDELKGLIIARFDQVDEDHAVTLKSNAAIRRRVTGVDWPTVLTVVTLVVVPIIVAIVGKPG